MLKPFCLRVLRTPLLLVAQIDATMVQTLAKLTFDGRETSVPGSRSYPEVVYSCAPEDHFVVQTSASLTADSALPVVLALRTLRSEEGDGREHVAKKVNSRSFNLHRHYSESLTLSNVGEHP